MESNAAEVLGIGKKRSDVTREESKGRRGRAFVFLFLIICAVMTQSEDKMMVKGVLCI